MDCKALCGVEPQEKQMERLMPVKGRNGILVWVLYGMCALLVVGVAMNAWELSRLVTSAFVRGLTFIEERYLLVSGFNIVLDAIALAVFIAFVLSVGRRAEFFSRAQTARLMVLGGIDALGAVTGLLIPAYVPPVDASAAVLAVAAAPELDLASLMLSVTFFALAGTFEYGRILQQDSDGIL